MSKAEVFLAESGLKVEIESFSNLENLKSQLEYLVPSTAQILLTPEGNQWKGQAESGNIIFLFNRMILDPQNGAMANMSIDIEPPVPLSEVKVVSPVQTASLPERLQSFTAAFISHSKYGKSALEIARRHASTCDKLLNEQNVQSRALAIAIQNLINHGKSAHQTFQAFNNHAQKEFSKHSSLLNSFPADLSTLSQIPIHASISAESRKLDDYVPKDKLYAWVQRCQMAHGIFIADRDHLSLKTAQLVETMNEIKRGSDAETLQNTGVDFPKMQKLLEAAFEAVSRMETNQNYFERDITRVESTCKEILSNSIADPPVKIQAIEALYKIHVDEYIPEITKLDRYARETVLYFSDSKLHMTQVLQTKLQTISHYQSVIASVTPTITTLSNALNMQSEALLQLLHVHRMAPAWGATLVEVVRRKEFVKIFLQKAKEMADVLNQFRSQEQRRRETFKGEIFRYVPQGLIHGLEDIPPYCEISISNTKDTLPSLGMDDISAFERLVNTIRQSQTSRGSHTTAESNVASDSISKLQATMMKMIPQLDHIDSDFEKIVAKSDFNQYAKKLEEENKMLKKLAPSKGSSQPRISVGTPPKDGESSYSKQEEKIKAYEAKIKSLERILQERYHDTQASSAEMQKSMLEEQKKVIETQQSQMLSMKEENDLLVQELRQERENNDVLQKSKTELEKLYGDVLVSNQEISHNFSKLEADFSNQNRLLVEVSSHLNSCLLSLKSTEESVINCDSVVIPNSFHADNLRQLMRKVEDDIISQMALLTNFRNSLNESACEQSDDAQTIANELVGLLQRVGELETMLREKETLLTETQAKEAVIEADCASVRTILAKTSESLERHQLDVSTLNQVLEEQKIENKSLKEKLSKAQEEYLARKAEIGNLEARLEESTHPDGELQSLVYSKDAQLRVSKEALEDWTIISRLSLETLSKYYSNWLQLETLIEARPPSPVIEFSDLLNFDPEFLPDELDQFLSTVGLLSRQTYEKLTIISSLNSSNITADLISKFKKFKLDMSRRVTFQHSNSDRKKQLLDTKRKKRSVSNAFSNYSESVEQLINSGEIELLPDLLERYRNGLSVVQVFQVLIKNLIALDENTNVLGEVMFEDAIHQAYLLDLYFEQTGGLIGPLHGIPVVLSDECVVAGVDCTLGCICKVGEKAGSDSLLVKQLKSAGAIILCKSNVPWHLLFNEPANPVFGKTIKKDAPIESLGGRCGALALIAKSCKLLLCFGTDQEGGLRLSASNSSLFSFKPTANRLAWITRAGIYDTINSTGGPICDNIDSMKFAIETLMSPTLQLFDAQVVPFPFNDEIYQNALLSKKFTIGFYVDDQIIRSCPSVRRAVYNAAAKLHEKGHTLVKFDPPLSKSAFLLLQRMFANEKGSLPCLQANFRQQLTKLTTLFPMFTITKIPKFLKTVIYYAFGLIIGDSFIQDIALNQGGGSTANQSRSLEEYTKLIQEKEEFRNIFSNAMESPKIDCIICPVSPCPPAMGFISTPFILAGKFYASLFNLLDYPCGFVPNLAVVQRDDRIPSVIQYGHNDRYTNRADRNYNFLAMMALEEFNNCVDDGSIVGKPIGVQVVGKPFQEEIVLAVMKILTL